MKTILTTLILAMVLSFGVMAQAPPPPTDPTAGGNQHPNGSTGAPLDPGTGILLILAGAYGLKSLKKVIMLKAVNN